MNYAHLLIIWIF